MHDASIAFLFIKLRLSDCQVEPSRLREHSQAILLSSVMEQVEQPPQLHVIVQEAKEVEAMSGDETTIRQTLLQSVQCCNQWWLRLFFFTVLLICGQSAGTLLGRLYFNEGGKSKWMAALVQPAGFPILILLLIIFHIFPSSCKAKDSKFFVSLFTLASLYFSFLGLVSGGLTMMYTYGLCYLPVSTYALICSTQLAFNAVFAFYINSQKFTALILNSVVLLTTSAALLVVGVDNTNSKGGSDKQKFLLGFIFTIGGCAIYALVLSVTQHLLQKVLKSVTPVVILEQMILQSFAASAVCAVGLFASGEWKTMATEIHDYRLGKTSYVMTLVWTAVSWQVYTIGSFGLLFEVSSLFTNVIGTVALPIVPVLAVFFFDDKLNGVKVVAMLLVIWGFLSYIYQHYLDDLKSKKAFKKISDENTECPPCV
ncbi:probable purine permease 11 [Daucus carota subsp. sativus]|uniref:probable purine permease 11 n=1 Tax=Daucus carota subsp. sativus TaxID=79200 RepID=UPI0007F03483|nr:PREDICTED: probable purine permease 11 [Daucus carota subsp. sativus]